MGSPYAVVRFGNNWIADFINEFPAAVKIVNEMVAGCGDAGLLVIFFHL